MVRRALLALLLVLGAQRAEATTYYMSLSTNVPGGSDAVSCANAQSISTPKKTFASAAACLTPGDTLYVRGGFYDENILTVPSGTSWASKVRVVNYPSETVWFRPTSGSGGGHVIWLDCNCSYVEFDGISADGTLSNQAGMYISNNNGNTPHHIRWQNATCYAGTQGAGACVDVGAHTAFVPAGSNEFLNVVVHGGGVVGECGFNCASYGFYLKSPNNLIDGADIYDVAGAGIQIYSNGGGNSVSGNTISNTKIHDITRDGTADEVWGILILGDHTTVYNCLIYNIQVGNVSSGLGGIVWNHDSNRVLNNTLYNVRNSGLRIDSATNSTVQNNIVYLSGGADISRNADTGTTLSNNLTGTNPVFVTLGSDFHLQASSPAVNAGTNLSAIFTTDKDGVMRPSGVAAWEIGAYEATTTPTTVTGTRATWFWKVHHF